MGTENHLDKNQSEEFAESVANETRKANKYLTMGWQVLGPVAAGVGLGLFIDNKSDQKFPLWTVILGGLSIIVSLWQLIKNTK